MRPPVGFLVAITVVPLLVAFGVTLAGARPRVAAAAAIPIAAGW